MPQFIYVAKGRDGGTVSGSAEAPNSALALGRLREQGLNVETIRCARPENVGSAWLEALRREVIWPVRYRVRPDEVGVFLRILRLCWKHNLPIQEALGHLARCTRNRHMADVLQDAYQYVSEGGRLSVLMAARPWVFRPEQIEMVASAEEVGGLERALDELIVRVDVDLELRRFLFPLTVTWWVMLAIACLTLGQSGLTLRMPAAARIYLHGFGLADVLDTLGFTLLVAGLVCAVIAAFRVAASFNPSVARAWAILRRTIPLLGGIQRSFTAARFCRTFACTFGSGLTLGPAIRAAGRSSGDAELEDAAQRVAVDTGYGAPLAHSFARTKRFPPEVISYLQTGEVSGRVDELMNHVAEQLERDAMFQIHRLTIGVAFVVVMSLLGRCMVAVGMPASPHRPV